jgi:small-conductance mechanosensitive channel
MEIEFSQIQTWFWPAVFLVAGVALGVVADRLLQSLLRRLSRTTEWGWDDAVAGAMERVPIFWLAAAGAYAAVEGLELPDTIRSVLQDGLVALVILSVTLVAARLTAVAVSVMTRRTPGGIPSSSLITNIAKILVFALGLILVLGQLGVEITPLITGLGIGGLAVALALQDTLSNLFAGFQIILSRQVENGDFIRLESGEEGYVTDVKWRNTTIKSRLDDNEVVIPNRKLADSTVVNFSLPNRPLWMRLEVGVSYASDLEEVERVTLEVAREVLDEVGVLETVREEGREPVVRFREFGDSSVNLALRVWVPEYSEQFLIRHELVKRIHARYREKGITIPFPMRTLEFGSSLRVEEGEEGGGDAPAEERIGSPTDEGGSAPEQEDRTGSPTDR